METPSEEKPDKENSLETPNSTVETEQPAAEKKELTAEELSAQEEITKETVDKKVEDYQKVALAEGGEELLEKVREELNEVLENKKSELVETFGAESSEQIEQMIDGIKMGAEEKMRQFTRGAELGKEAEQITHDVEGMRAGQQEEGEAKRKVEEGLQNEQRTSLLENNGIEVDDFSPEELKQKAQEVSVEIRDIRKELVNRGLKEMDFQEEAVNNEEGELAWLRNKEEDTRPKKETTFTDRIKGIFGG